MNFEINKERYVSVTSAGAYYCMLNTEDDIARNFLRARLQEKETAKLTKENIELWFGNNDLRGLEMLNHLQKLNWLNSSDNAHHCSTEKLEDFLPKILGNMSSQNKVLLADTHGFYISSVGFPHESAEEISALSADIISLHERHKGVLNGNLKLSSSNWGMIDAAGHSQLGFWPLHVGKEIFSLVIGGRASLNHPSFLQLAWALNSRYAKEIKC